MGIAPKSATSVARYHITPSNLNSQSVEFRTLVLVIMRFVKARWWPVHKNGYDLPRWRVGVALRTATANETSVLDDTDPTL